MEKNSRKVSDRRWNDIVKNITFMVAIEGFWKGFCLAVGSQCLMLKYIYYKLIFIVFYMTFYYILYEGVLVPKI